MNPLTPAGRRVVTGGLMLSMFLAAVDGTIVATALPAIVADLHGFTLYPWVGSVYLLVSAATVPIYGKLADLYGRRRFLFLGIALFLAGSALCGSSRSMPELILFRAFQGLGAGAVLPLSTTIVGDIYTREERARMQGYFSSVWGISAIVGPALGGFLVTALSWRWVFYINLPIGLLAVMVLARYYRERVAPREHRVDYLGAAALAVGVSAFMLALLQGRDWGWSSLPVLGLLGLAGVTLAYFVSHERRFPEPLLPMELFRNRIILVSNAGGLLAGILMVAVSFAVPIFVTGVQGGSAAVAGAAIAPVSIGWPIASTLGGRLGLRTGFRFTAILGMSLCGLASLWFLAVSPAAHYAYLAAGSILLGLGLGFSTTGFLIEVQNAVPWQLRGAATASQQFVRSLGSTIGLAVMGAVLYARTLSALRARSPEALAALGGPNGALHAVNRMLDPVARQGLHASLLSALSGALAAGVRSVFWVTLLAALGALFAVLYLPRERAGRASAEASANAD